MKVGWRVGWAFLPLPVLILPILILPILILLVLPGAPGVAQQSALRVATWNVELARDGPGLLLRDILRGGDEQIDAVAQVIARAAPDILVLQRVDHDFELRALDALRDRIAQQGVQFPYIYARRPNSGRATGLDMDGDGRCCDARDAQGFGWFEGRGGMAVLSRYSIDTDAVRDFSEMLWRDLPGARLPRLDGQPFPSAAAQAMQRLSSVAHWAIPVDTPEGRLTLLTFHAAPPVFDGREDRNGLRNADEIRFWRLFLDGAFGPAPQGRFVLLGDANLDPHDGDGSKPAIRALLTDPRLHDARPMRPGPVRQQPGQRGDPHLDTVDWPAPGPGRLRASYILPSADLRVLDSGVLWPAADDPFLATVRAASRHRLIWADLRPE